MHLSVWVSIQKPFLLLLAGKVSVTNFNFYLFIKQFIFYTYTLPSKSHSGIVFLSELRIAQLSLKKFFTVLLLGDKSIFSNFRVNKNEFQTKM